MLNRRSLSSDAFDVPALLLGADALAARGRHAAAERTLREVAAALARRRAPREAAAVLVRLGRLLSERGRAPAALRAFEAASAMAGDSRDAMHAAETRVWLASSMADMRQLAEAEALCREVRRELPGSDARAIWATSVLARVSLWQGRCAEARVLVEAMPPQSIVDERSAFVEATAVRVLLAAGDVFEAGRRLRVGAAHDTAAPATSVLTQLMLTAARLRFQCAVGDLMAAERVYEDVRLLARGARTPLREVRSGLVWVDALRRAGQLIRADRELARLRRLGRAAPPLLRIELDRADRGPGASLAVAVEVPRASGLAALVEACREPVGDDPLTAALGQALTAVGGRGLEVVAAANRVSIAKAGEGAACSVALLAVDAGAPVGPVGGGGRQDAAVPIRWDGHVVAGLAARWERTPAEASAWLAAAAAVLAPWVEARLRQHHDEARCAVLAPGLLGRSAAMASVRGAVARAAPAPFAVLIHGESGVGKELVARALHAMSARHAQRMCDVNCAALPDDLLESELFGYVRGAFTGALGDRAGFFEDAHGGTLFLDEVVDLSARAQAKLLRVLQQQEVRRLGETRTRRIDVRIVSAANRDPREAVAAGAFRSDLVYRLDVIRISVPPLRERREDVADLAHRFWHAAASGVGSRALLGRDAVDALASYDWPGNVRELQNVLAAMAVSAPRNGRIGTQHLPAFLAETGRRQETTVRLEDARRECERRAVLLALARSAGHRGRAARELGLSRQGLLKLMARVGVPVRRPAGG